MSTTARAKTKPTMTKKRKIVFIHPQDRSRWHFPPNTVVSIDSTVTPGKFYEFDVVSKKRKVFWFVGWFIRWWISLFNPRSPR